MMKLLILLPPLSLTYKGQMCSSPLTNQNSQLQRARPRDSLRTVCGEPANTYQNSQETHSLRETIRNLSTETVGSNQNLQRETEKAVSDRENPRGILATPVRKDEKI